jgi:hypothetical protein
MIPKNITKNHILNAIKKIDRDGISKGRDSKKFKIIYERKLYPPKYIISLANRYANREELRSSSFNGGQETNDYLSRLGFKIIESISPPRQSLKRVNRKKTRAQSGVHNERCPKCKQTIEKMLRKIYRDVKSNYKIKVAVLPEDFEKNRLYHEIKDIFLKIKKYRGYENFVRTSNLPRVDFYIPDPGFIVEFDESQHFTPLRKESLLKYPSTLKIGFDAKRWIELCDKIGAKDNNPPYRDEQRAWYDTLRDFLPMFKGLNPTIRLFSKDFHWCSLNPEVQSDIKKFKNLLECKNRQMEIIVKEDTNPSLARIIIAGEWEGDINISKRLLKDICGKWPKGKNVDFLVTCGAFLNFNWPQSLTDVGDSKCPQKKVLNLLISEAKKQCDLLVDERLRQKLIARTKYITIGIDSFKDKISLSNTYIRPPHVELVALVDLRTNRYFWTGKSYPTTGQEMGLIRFEDLSTHFVGLPLGKTMILGCHDLNVFNLRGKVATKKEWRKKIRKDFYKMVKNKTPRIVLHHPHTTDSSRIWTAAWNELSEIVPTVKKYISAGRYFNRDGERSNLNEVLNKTKLGDTIDFIVNI